MTDLSFTRLVDIKKIRELMEAHYKFTGIGASIFDADENLLVVVGEHTICKRFHLIHPVSRSNCRKNDAHIKAHLSSCCDGYFDYRCIHGLAGIAMPIMIDDKHLATFFTEQFFYDDDKPEVEYIRNQADKFGFNEVEYLEAMDRVPVFSREWICKIVEYYRTLVRIIVGTEIQVQELRRETAELNQVKEDLLISRFCIDKAGIGIYRTDGNGMIFGVNDHACKCLGYTEDELLGQSIFDIDPVITQERILELKKILDDAGTVTHESIHKRKDGTTSPVEIAANILEFNGKIYDMSFVKDITERKWAEDSLRESESRVRRKLESILDPEGDIGELELADIIDAPQIQALMDDLYRNTCIKMSIIDLKGKVLVDVGWQEICWKFHRGHPETRERCRESDTVMTEGVAQGEYRTYRCRNNMWHLVTPIFVGENHMGNLFMGQFFFENEDIDFELFRAQAKEFGFPEEKYMAALKAVPRHSKECINNAKAFFLRLIDMFSKLSYGNIKLARLLTERDRLAETLGQADKVVENSPVVLFRCKGNDEWPVEFVSANVVQFGYAPEEFLSGASNYSSIIHPHDLEKVRQEVHDICGGGTNRFRQEYRIITKSGNIRWVNELAHLERDEAGRVKYFERVVIDVSDCKQAEERALKSEAKYQAMIESFDGLIYICSADYRIEYTNEKMIRWTGKDSVGEFCYKTLHDRDSVCPWCVNDRVFSGETVHWEVQCPKDGHWYYVINTPVRNEDGIVSKLSMITDITKRKEVAEELKKKKQLLETLFSSISDFVYVKDTKRRFVLANREFLDIMDLTEEQQLGKTSEEIDRTCVKILNDEKTVLEHGLTCRQELTIEKAGRCRVFDSVMVPLRDDNNVIAGLVGVGRDISELKKTEASLVESQEVLKLRSKELEETNCALRIILQQCESNKREMENQISVNISQLVMPYLQKLKKVNMSNDGRAYLNIVESNLNEITSSFSVTLSRMFSNLSPKEILVASLVKEGLQDKSIAEMLHISLDTVKAHRRNIRKKLGITGKKTNLRGLLYSLNND